MSFLCIPKHSKPSWPLQCLCKDKNAAKNLTRRAETWAARSAATRSGRIWLSASSHLLISLVAPPLLCPTLTTPTERHTHTHSGRLENIKNKQTENWLAEVNCRGADYIWPLTSAVKKTLLASSPYPPANNPLPFTCQLSPATVLFVSLVTFCSSLKFSPRTTDQESETSQLPNLWLCPGAPQGTFPKCCWIFFRWGKTWNLGRNFCSPLWRKSLRFFLPSG